MTQENSLLKPLLLGTGNLDKVRELGELLAGLCWDVRSLKAYPSVAEPVEDGATFEANALKKARYYAEQFGVCCVADDSGLCVDALNGAPGVFSARYAARYAGETCSYTDNNRKLLGALKDVPESQRTARFVCCAAFVAPEGVGWEGPREHVVLGTVEGTIALEGRGANGFGYDPVFIPAGMSATFAEMTGEAKHALSHRGNAFRALRSFLESQV